MRQKQQQQPSSRPFTSIEQAQTSMQQLLDQLDELSASPPTLTMMREGSIPSRSSSQERKLLQKALLQTQQFFDELCRAVDQGHLKPSRKHAEALSRLVECVLYNYSCCCGSSTLDTNEQRETFPLSKKCQQVLKVLRKDWNLDIQGNHFQHAISVAIQEENYKLASDLFEQQIDPNAGNSPVSVAIDNPQGMYAIAKLHSPSDDESSSLSSAGAEHVMDAVQRLVMVSPNDQTIYLLAAGNALGYAGRWKDLVDYWKSSLLSKQWGAPLVAAVMQACWLCQQPDEAWKVLEESNLLVVESVQSSSSSSLATTPGFGGEWQYGGERDLMDPLVRDVAMKVVTSFQPLSSDDSDGSTNKLAPSASQVALDLYHHSQQEGRTISLDALTGVVRACEKDGERQHALSIILSIIDEVKDLQRSWIVPGNRLLIEDRDKVSSSEDRYDCQSLLLDMSGPMASAMRMCNASSNFGTSLFLLSLLQSKTSSSNADGFEKLLDSDEVLNAAMVALCGLRCYDDAVELFHSRDDTQRNVALKMVYEYAKSNQQKFGTQALGNPWISTKRHIAALLRNVDKQRVTNASEQEKQLLLQILATAMNSAVHAHQPELSLQLLQWVEQEAFQSSSSEPDFGAGSGPLNDAVTAEYIRALRWTNDVPNAISVFEECTRKHEKILSEWKKTVSAGLMAMVAGGRGKDALKIFKSIGEDALCTESYITIGRYLAKNADWKDVIELYRDATACGFSSEELSLMAMKAVTSTRIDNRLRILRAIVAECANEVGLDRQTWLTTNYFHIKRELGFDYARLLMWWNDPERATLDELILAIKEFDNEAANELRPNNDAIRVIVKGAALLDSLDLETVDGYERIPKSVSQWTSLLDNVLISTQSSPISSDPNFIDSVVQAYKSLGCSRECISYIQKIMELDHVRIRKSTLKEVLEAAQMEQAKELSRDLRMLLNAS